MARPSLLLPRQGGPVIPVHPSNARFLSPNAPAKNAPLNVPVTPAAPSWSRLASPARMAAEHLASVS